MRQGDLGTYVLLITSGKVKITRTERDGRELLLAVRGPGEVLGDITAWDRRSRTATATTIDACVAYVLSAERFRLIISQSGQRDVLLRHLIARLQEGEDVRADLADLPAGQRVARILLRLSATEDQSPVEPLELRLSQDEIARAAGLSRSAVAAELARLRRLGLITTGRRVLVLSNVPGLRSVVDTG
jgi:CRP/FNR family transcriptional regulator, cyclic AMP receptor protein